MGDVGCRLEAGAAESVYGGCTGCVRKAGRQCCGANFIGGLAIRDLNGEKISHAIDKHGMVLRYINDLRTFPKQISSTKDGSKPMRSLVSLSSAYTIYSREVSLNPPFFPLHSGVRMAKVITTSSAFFDVLFQDYQL